MNDDLISRQAAIDVASCECGELRGVFGRIEEKLKYLPPAQPERKTGKWLIDRGLYKCSSCNQLWTEWWAVSKPIERMNKEMPYCPVCGSYNGEERNNGRSD